MRYEDSGSVCSFSDYIDELEHEIVGKDAQLQVAKHLVRELVKVAEWYEDINEELLDGGKLARKTLKQNADKIKSLLGE